MTSFAIILGAFCTTCLQAGASLYRTIPRSKHLMDTCIPKLHLIQCNCLAPCSLMLSYLSRSQHWSAGLLGGKQTSMETPFWILHQCSISASSSRASLVSASLGIFVLYSSKWCRNVLQYLRRNLMIHGSRWQVYCICGRHNHPGGMLKTSHCYRYKRSHSISEDEHWTTSSMQHKWRLL